MQRLIVLSFCLSVCSFLDREAQAENWVSFQNGGHLQTTAELPIRWGSDEGIAWTVALAGYGQSSPVIWNRQVYVTYCSGDMKDEMHLHALRLDTGETVWDQKLKNSTPEKNSSYVSRAAPTPVADSNGVIAFFEGGNLGAWQHDGTARWQRDLVQDYGPITARHGLASSLEQDDAHVYVWVERSDQPYVLAIDKSDGTTTWKSPGLGSTTWSSPRLVPVKDGHHLVLSASGRIVGLDPQTGKRLWELEDVANNTVPTPIPLGQGKFLMGASEGRGEQPVAGAVKSSGVVSIVRNDKGEFTATFSWRAEKATSSFGSPISADGNAYFVSRAGIVYCLDVATGKVRYAKRSAGSVWATPLQVADRIYLFGRQGTTTVIKTGNSYEELATNTLWEEEPAAAENAPSGPGGFGGPVLYGVAVAQNKLVLRRGDRVYCVGSK